MSTERSIKCVVVGDSCVGKTCLLTSYTTDNFLLEYVPTVYDNFFVKLVVNNISIRLNLWDTPGVDDYDRFRPCLYSETDIFLVCFSVTIPSSYHNVIPKWYPEIKHHCPNVPIILVGTKIELREDENALSILSRQGLSPIDRAQGQKLANKIKAVKYLECSALTQSGLKVVFGEAVRTVLSTNSLSLTQSKCTIS